MRYMVCKLVKEAFELLALGSRQAGQHRLLASGAPGRISAEAAACGGTAADDDGQRPWPHSFCAVFFSAMIPRLILALR